MNMNMNTHRIGFTVLVSALLMVNGSPTEVSGESDRGMMAQEAIAAIEHYLCSEIPELHDAPDKFCDCMDEIFYRPNSFISCLDKAVNSDWKQFMNRFGDGRDSAESEDPWYYTTKLPQTVIVAKNSKSKHTGSKSGNGIDNGNSASHEEPPFPESTFSDYTKNDEFVGNSKSKHTGSKSGNGNGNGDSNKDSHEEPPFPESTFSENPIHNYTKNDKTENRAFFELDDNSRNNAAFEIHHHFKRNAAVGLVVALFMFTLIVVWKRRSSEYKKLNDCPKQQRKEKYGSYEYNPLNETNNVNHYSAL